MQPTWSNIYIVQSFQNGDWERTWKPPPIDRWGAWVDRAVNHYYWQLLLWSISSQCQYCNYNSAENEKEPHHRAITLNYCVENVENTQNPLEVQLSLKPASVLVLNPYWPWARHWKCSAWENFDFRFTMDGFRLPNMSMSTPPVNQTCPPTSLPFRPTQTDKAYRIICPHLNERRGLITSKSESCQTRHFISAPSLRITI